MHGALSFGRRPRVTVLVAAFNSAATIRSTVASALRQSLDDLEVLVVDDGSTDDTVDLVRRFSDRRVRIVCNEKNLGIPATRRRGAEEARGSLLAILDSDDLAHPQRLRLQADFLDAHPRCGAVGSWSRVVDAVGRFRGLRIKPCDPASLRARTLFRNVVKDATAMTRTGLMRELGLRDELPVCELLDLWQRVSRKHDVANLPQVLTTYRDHPGGVTKRRRELVREAKLRLIGEGVGRLGLRASSSDFERHYLLTKPALIPRDPGYLEWLDDWLARLESANRSGGVFPRAEFEEALAEQWWKAALRAARGPGALRQVCGRAAFGWPALRAPIRRAGLGGAALLALARECVGR